MKQNTTWRWIFLINLPTGGIAALILLLCLRVPRNKKKTFRQHAKEFDYLGLTLITGGVASLLVGLNNGEANWNRVQAIVPLVIGAVAILAGAINEIYTKQSPVIPPRLFRTRTTAGVIGIVFSQGLVFFAGAFFLPVYFQVLGSSALMAGVRNLPFALGSSISSTIGGLIVAKVYRNYKIVMMVSLAIMTVSQGLKMCTTKRNSADSDITPARIWSDDYA